MLRSDIVQSLLDANPELGKATVTMIVETFYETIIAQLVANGRVELRGFGAFSTRRRQARLMLVPHNRRAIPVPAGRKVYFKASTMLCLHRSAE